MHKQFTIFSQYKISNHGYLRKIIDYVYYYYAMVAPTAAAVRVNGIFNIILAEFNQF